MENSIFARNCKDFLSTPPVGQTLAKFSELCGQIFFSTELLPLFHKIRWKCVTDGRRISFPKKKEKASQNFAIRRWQNKVKSVFSRDMRVGKNSSQPASVPEGRAQQAATLTF
ncbi:MAG: hypothetical protein IKU62_03380 [Ruminiclostridium sp.]|nr:hypothetical protein [Ruminiclostridium sp.]